MLPMDDCKSLSPEGAMSVRKSTVRRWTLGSLAVAATIVAFVSAASAHEGPPIAEDLQVWQEGGETRWVFQTNFGVMTSEAPRRYVCEEAFEGGVRFHVAALDTDTWVAFTGNAIMRTDDGCRFEKVRDLSSGVVDVAVRRESEEVAYLMNGPEAYGIWSSSDAGESFEKLSIDRPDLEINAISFVDEGRLAVSAFVSGSAEGVEQGEGRIFTTDAPGEARVLDGYAYPTLLAARGDQILWQGRLGDEQHVVWGTLDAPVDATRAVEGIPRTGAIDLEGNEVWAGRIDGDGRGLLHGVGGETGVAWEVVDEDHTATCLATSGGEVYVCSRRGREGYDLERRESGEGAEMAVDFQHLEGPRASCPEDSSVAQTCPGVWGSLEDSLEERAGGDAADAGAGTDTDVAGGDAAGPGDVAGGSDGDAGRGSAGGNGAAGAGCRTVPGELPVSLAGWLLVGGLVVRTARRRR